MSKTILFLGQGPSLRQLVSQELPNHGLEVTALSGSSPLPPLDGAAGYGAVLVEISGPGDDVVETIRRVKTQAPAVPILLLADPMAPLWVIDALRGLVVDYLVKPFNASDLVQMLSNAMKPPCPATAQPSENPDGRTGARSVSPLIGQSLAIQNVRRQIEEVAATHLNVLIHGEKGVGKVLVARRIHEISRHGDSGNCVTINCPAIPESSLESELFGQQPGASVEEEMARPGRLELAPGGTLIFVEIAQLPPAMQARLLQVIETREVWRIGGRGAVRVDSRFLATTSDPLTRLVPEGRLRADLFYRMTESHIQIPPLRERREDIPLLADHFLKLYGARFGRSAPAVSREVAAALIRHAWPGNVAELEALARNYVLNGKERQILDALANGPQPEDARQGGSLLERNQIQALLAVLQQTRWNQRKAAYILGISYSALRRRIEKFGLKNHPMSGGEVHYVAAPPQHLESNRS